MFFITNETDLQFNWQEHPVQGLYFYRSGIPFHAKMIGIIDQLQQKYKQTYFYAIDAEHFNGSCIRFAVESVPTLVVLKDAKEIKKIEGSVKTQDFINVFDDICIR
jgi:thioredoxin-like negative regulator of GroEL